MEGLVGKSEDYAWPVAVLYERLIYSSTYSLLKHLRLDFSMDQDISQVNKICWCYGHVSSSPIISWCKQFRMGCLPWESVIISLFAEGSCFFVLLQATKLSTYPRKKNLRYL